MLQTSLYDSCLPELILLSICCLLCHILPKLSQAQKNIQVSLGLPIYRCSLSHSHRVQSGQFLFFIHAFLIVSLFLFSLNRIDYSTLVVVSSLQICCCFPDWSTVCFPNLFLSLMRINVVFRLCYAVEHQSCLGQFALCGLRIQKSPSGTQTGCFSLSGPLLKSDLHEVHTSSAKQSRGAILRADPSFGLRLLQAPGPPSLWML